MKTDFEKAESVWPEYRTKRKKYRDNREPAALENSREKRRDDYYRTDQRYCGRKTFQTTSPARLVSDVCLYCSSGGKIGANEV